MANLLTHIKENAGKLYAFDLAEKLFVTEADLAYARIGYDVTLLSVTKENIKEFIGLLESLGEVKAITRNPYAVSEHCGSYCNQHLNGYKKIDISSTAGLILNPRGLDLRIFFNHWQHVFYFNETHAEHQRHSLQIYNQQGVAIHKIYLTENSNMLAFDKLLSRYPQPEVISPMHFHVKKTYSAQPPIGESGFNQEIDKTWRNMHEVHDFYLLMHRFSMNREQLFQAVSDDLAYQVNPNAFLDLLALCREHQEEITLFVSNPGCVQIFTGFIKRFVTQRGWINIYNSMFTLHVLARSIARCWVVKKPADTGYVTSLEVFADDGVQILQVYGQRSEGQMEHESWRGIINKLSSHQG